MAMPLYCRVLYAELPDQNDCYRAVENELELDRAMGLNSEFCGVFSEPEEGADFRPADISRGSPVAGEWDIKRETAWNMILCMQGLGATETCEHLLRQYLTFS